MNDECDIVTKWQTLDLDEWYVITYFQFTSWLLPEWKLKSFFFRRYCLVLLLNVTVACYLTIQYDQLGLFHFSFIDMK